MKFFVMLTTVLCVMNVNASIVSVDWKVVGDNQITRDTRTGFEWLDLSVTRRLSYITVKDRIDSGSYDGWRYATTQEVSGFMDSFGGDSNYYNGSSTQNNGLFESMFPFWDATFCPNGNLSETNCLNMGGYITAVVGDKGEFRDSSYGSHKSVQIYDHHGGIDWRHVDLVELDSSDITDNSTGNGTLGHALVRVSTVPIPATVWLFASGLIGLIGFARR